MQNIQNIPEETKIFCTGSSYTGEWNIEMNGNGVYVYPDGTEYHGTFLNGLFHGSGILITPSKFKVYCKFKMGKIIEYESYKFHDDLPYSPDNWKYLTDCDRRYAREIENGIPAVGNSYETNTKPARNIPDNYYDCTNSFFRPNGGAICDDETLITKRIAPEFERKYIQKYFRNTKKDPIGFNSEIIDANTKSMKFADCILQTDCNICKCKLTQEQIDKWERNRINYLDSLTCLNTIDFDCNCSSEDNGESSSSLSK